MFQSNRNTAELAALGFEPHLTPKKLEILDKNERLCYEKAGGNSADQFPRDEQSYFLGAFHAFEDTLDLLYSDDEIADMPEEEKRKLSVKTKLVITAAVITTGVYVAPKLERKFQLKARARGLKETVVKEVNFIKGAFRG